MKVQSLTLICAVEDSDGNVALLSDIAISQESDVVGPIELPVQKAFSYSYGRDHQPENTTISRLVQKSVVFGDSVIAWAGNYLQAAVFLKYLRNRQDKISPETIREFFDDALREYKVDLSIIYLFRSKGRASIVTFRCEEFVQDGRTFYVAGDGSYRIQQFDHGVSGSVSADSQMITRMAYLISLEITDENAYYYNISGGYELTFHDDKGWYKSSYNVAIFDKSGHDFGWSSVIQLNYHDSDILLTSIRCNKVGNSIDRRVPGWRFIPQLIDAGYVGITIVPGTGAPLPLQSHRWAVDKISDVNFTVAVCLKNGEDDDFFVGRHYRPPVFQVKFLDNELGKYQIFSKGFFRADIEEIFHGRPFVPPVEWREHYLRERWKHFS